eukprot:scaffold76104_cov72-Attheya_sp.AAC.2
MLNDSSANIIAGGGRVVDSDVVAEARSGDGSEVCWGRDGITHDAEKYILAMQKRSDGSHTTLNWPQSLFAKCPPSSIQSLITLDTMARFIGDFRHGDWYTGRP